MHMPSIKVASSPHIMARQDTKSIMLDVVIALMPALFAGIYFFGLRAAVVVAVSVCSAVFCEYAWQKLTHTEVTVGDYSAAITGVLLAFNLPASVPLWIPAIGSAFAIIIVKQFFGGLGQNFANPALAGRAFLLASFPVIMTHWVPPHTALPLFSTVDVLSSPTPLAIVKEGIGMATPSYIDMFLGNTSGCIGETSELALIIGGAYLLARRVISWRIPTAYLLSFAAMAYIFGTAGLFSGNVLFHMLSGGVFLGAIFMATDYSTSPTTPRGQLIFGVGCGVIAMVIRLWGSYPEGVSYSILIMNILAPLIDKMTRPRLYGNGAQSARGKV